MRAEQTKAFRFAVEEAKRASELWVVVFMDDIDSPDLHVHADAAVIKEFAPLVLQHGR